MTIPDYQTLMLPVLRLAAEGGERRVAEISGRIADEFSLTDEERAQLLPSGRQTVLHNRIHWAKFYMTKAGLILSPARGRFLASDAGQRVLKSQPSRIDVAFLLQEPSFQDFYKRDEPEVNERHKPVSFFATNSVASTPEERIEMAYSELHATSRRELLERIANNSPSFFEKVIVDLLVAMGYGGTHKNAAQQLGRTGDGGVDGVINEDRLGLDRVYVQAKRYSVGNAVGRPDVQGFVGSLVGLGATKGVFVTTSTFSSQVREFVRHLAQRIILIDGQTLADLMIEHGVGVRTSQIITLRRLDEDFFSEDV